MNSTGTNARLGKSCSGAKKKAANGYLFGWLPSKSLVDAHSESAWNLMRGSNGREGTGARTAIGGKRD